MSYARTTSDEELDTKVIQMLVQLLGLDVSDKELAMLAAAFSNQLAAKKSIERFDVQAIVPILNMDARWDE
jgi:hypothetical protein